MSSTAVEKYDAVQFLVVVVCLITLLVLHHQQREEIEDLQDAVDSMEIELEAKHTLQERMLAAYKGQVQMLQSQLDECEGD